VTALLEQYRGLHGMAAGQEGSSMSTPTPWGSSQSSRELAPGIVRYDTASHGGYYLSPERVAQMPAPLRAFQPGPGRTGTRRTAIWPSSRVVAPAFPQFSGRSSRRQRIRRGRWRPVDRQGGSNPTTTNRPRTGRERGSVKKYAGERTPDGVSVVVISDNGRRTLRARAARRMAGSPRRRDSAGCRRRAPEHRLPVGTM
jgi:hypothetical protein